MLYYAFRYNVFFVLDCEKLSSRGLYYDQALQHVMIGAYLGQVCLLGLLILRTADDLYALGPAILIGMLLTTTVIAHRWMRKSLQLHVKYLPPLKQCKGPARPPQRASSRSHGEKRPAPSCALPTHPALGDHRPFLWLDTDGLGILNGWRRLFEGVATVVLENASCNIPGHHIAIRYTDSTPATRSRSQ